MKRIRIGRLLLFLFLLALAAGAAAAAPTVKNGYEMYRSAVAAVTPQQKADEIRAQAHYTALSELPPIYTDAVLSVEDRRFYSHCGIDPLAILRAAGTDLATGTLAEGGSTITQQLAKNLYYTQEKRFSRKVAEVFTAFALERAFTKDQLLELYINSIYYGSGYYNIYDAAEGYFGKTPSELSDAECTLLAGLPNAPSAYSLDASPELALERQAQVLKKMVRNHKLTQAQADTLHDEAAALLAQRAG